MIRMNIGIVPPVVVLLLVGFGACIGPAFGAPSPPSPSMQMYQEVSAAREKHSEVIWGDADASPEQLRTIVGELETDLGKLDQPLPQDLAEGNVYLRYRRFNILVDLIKLHARLGESETALARWRELMAMDWSADASWLTDQDGRVAALKSHPGFAEIADRYRAAAWWSKAPAFKSEYRPALSVDERIAGLSRLWTMAREGFVWFDRVPDLDWDRAYREAIPEVIAATDTEAYYRVLMRLVSRLHDGHSNVYAPEALKNRFYARPGLRTRRVEGRVVVTSVADPALREAGLAVGDEVLRIDGMPVRDYAERYVKPYQSSSTPQDLEVRMFWYGLLGGDAQKPVVLELRATSGKTYSVTAPRSGYSSLPIAEKPPLFHLRGDGIAVLRVEQLGDDAAVKAFEADFALLERARGLIIDLRGNGGGNSWYGGQILSRLSKQPLPMMRSLYRENPPFDLAGENPPRMRWRTIVDRGGFPVPDKTYDGPVAMLIDAATFSAAEDTAAVFKLMKRGPIVGEASGGSTGQPYQFDLPGGGSARICVKRDVYPDGDSFVGVGVKPDLVAAKTLRDVRKDEDSVLERAARALWEQH